MLNRRDIIFNIDNTHLIYKRGFLRSMVVYLKDLSPYRRQFSPYSESQNTIRVNLLGNYSTSYYYVVDFLFTYIPSPLIGPTVVLAIRFRYTIYSIAYCITAGESTSTNSLKYFMPRLGSAIAAGKIEISNLHKTFLNLLLQA